MKMEYDSVAQLDAELLNPSLGLDRRAELMAARITLDQAQRATPPRVEPPAGFTVNIPDNLGISDIIDQAGRKFQARSSIDGRRVIDIMPSTFRALLQGPHGLDWSNANQGGDVWQKMQPGIHVN
jgi:hypothetical protein